MSELTVLLAAARDGDTRAAGEAFSLLYDELRRLARARLREHRTMTLLDTTSLVHESSMKLVGDGKWVLSLVRDGVRLWSAADGRLAVGGSEPCGTLWATAGLEKVADLALPAGCPTSFVFSPDGTTLLTTVWEPQGLALWDARGGTHLVRHGPCIVGDGAMGDGDPADVLDAGFSNDGAHVFVGTLGGDVCIWPHPGAGTHAPPPHDTRRILALQAERHGAARVR